MKKNNLTVLLFAAIVTLIVLWLRENEMRVAAQSKLSNLQFNTTSTINEKGDVIADLSTQVGEMQAQLQRTVDECRGTVEDRDAQIVKLNEDTRIAASEHEEALAMLETDLKQNSEKYDTALKKKNTELSEMGDELRKTTERLAAALKEKEEAESMSYDAENALSTLRRTSDKLTADNRRLEALAKVCVESSSTADGPKIPA